MTTLLHVPAKLDLQLYKGDDWNEVFAYAIDGSAVDMSAGSCEAIFKNSADSVETTFNSTNSKLTCDVSGDITVALDPTDLTPIGSAGIYQLQYTDAAGEKDTLFAGNYSVVEDVPA